MKNEHPLSAHSVEEQCWFVTPNGDPPRVLHCGLKAGHEKEGFGHVDTYEARQGKTVSWHTEWFRMRDAERERLVSVITPNGDPPRVLHARVVVMNG